MAVIIREKKKIGEKEYIVKVFKTKPGRLVTLDEKNKAEKLDEFLAQKMKEIKREIKNNSFLKLKGKRGKVLRLWYEVGKRLEFIMDTSIVMAEDREFIWRALYDHAGELVPGPLTKRVLRDPKTSHFSYCYHISRFPWEFIEMAGDWTSWSEFFDRKETKNDRRIIEWIGLRVKEGNIKSRQNWLRPLTKAIHKEFENKDTTVFSEKELYERLDKIFLNLSKNE